MTNEGDITKDGIEVVNISDEMRESYLEYAMSVIIGRALPDVRDGLKPSARRIIYAMSELGNFYNKPFKKSARIVGDVIGKYHPHGDAPVYETLVRMAQEFSLRYPLIDGQGNFGSIDGDSAAHMRYTEARMSKITDELLADLEKETVHFVPNYDGSLKEPGLLPSRIPNILINGSSGIAVGMSTNIPPHNLTEVMKACLFYIQNPKAEVKEYLKIIKGPDFPTAGFISGKNGIQDAYLNGKGSIMIRSKVDIEPIKKGDRSAIIISELPYQVNKARLIEKIADLVRSKTLEGISDLRDESNRKGIRVVIELKKGEIPQIILNRLYKLTQMQVSYGIIFLALYNNQPKLFNIREMIKSFVEHRKTVIIRRTTFDMKKARAKAHILEGLKKAIENIDKVITIIKKSKTPDDARNSLILSFQFSQRQAKAILDMRLHRLTSLESVKISDELKKTLELIKELSVILTSETRLLEVINEEMNEVLQKYGDKRKTVIEGEREELNEADLIKDEKMVVTMTNTGYLKRTPLSAYRSQGRGGKGMKGISTREEDFVSDMFVASQLSTLLCFSNYGKAYWLKVHSIPEGSKTAKGRHISNLIKVGSAEKVLSILSLKDFSDGSHIVLVTKNGITKKTEVSAFANQRSNGILAINIDPNDELVGASLSQSGQTILMSSHNGKCIRFNEDNIRSMGRGARGVKGIELQKDDFVVAMDVLDKDASLLTVTERGYGKRTYFRDYRIQSRGGTGIFAIKVTPKNGKVCGVRSVKQKDDMMIITDQGKVIRIEVAQVPIIGRSTQGVRLINLNENEKVASIALIKEDGTISDKDDETSDEK